METVTRIDFKHARHNSEMSEYFDVLSFSELINEAAELKRQIELHPQDSMLQAKSRVLYSQFIKRLQLDAPELASDLQSQRSDRLEIVH